MIDEILHQIAIGPSEPDEICPSPEALRSTMQRVMEGEVPPTVLAALLMGLRCWGERPEHLQQVVEVMRANAVKFPAQPQGVPVFDTCGTGGDQHGMLNVSTAAALLASAAGLRVAKHGNRSVSSRSGSADVLESMGMRIDCDPEVSAAMLDELNFCFLFAPKYHPAMRHAGPTRRELRIRTIFNLAGPLSNPAYATHQLVGVSESALVPVMAQALRLLGVQRAMVVHGRNREDEISLTTVSEGLELRADGTLHPFIVDPVAMGLDAVEMADLLVEGPADSADAIRAIAGGARGPKSTVVNLNLAAVFMLADRAGDFQTAFQMAAEFQESGVADAHIAKIIERSHA